MYVWHLIFRACAGSFYSFFSLFTMRQLCCWEIWALLKWTPKTNAFSMQIFSLSPAFGQLVYSRTSLQRKIVKFTQFFLSNLQRRKKSNIHWSSSLLSLWSSYRNSDIWYLENKRMILLKKWNLVSYQKFHCFTIFGQTPWLDKSVLCKLGIIKCRVCFDLSKYMIRNLSQLIWPLLLEFRIGSKKYMSFIFSASQWG